MSVVTSATISQSVNGSVISFTDTSTGLIAPITRSLIVYDPNGNVLAAPVFSGNVATFDITSDAWFSFVETITDANGAYTQTINYLSTTFYQNAFSNAIASVSDFQSDFFGVVSNLNLSQDYYQAALRFFIGGFGVAATNMIVQANYYSVTPYYA